MKDKITFDEFMEIDKKLEITVGKIVGVEFLPNNKRMLKLKVFFGDEDYRTCVTNIGDKIDNPLESLMGANFPFITNLQPAIISKVESTVMIMIPKTPDGLDSVLSAGAILM